MLCFSGFNRISFSQSRFIFFFKGMEVSNATIVIVIVGCAVVFLAIVLTIVCAVCCCRRKEIQQPPGEKPIPQHQAPNDAPNALASDHVHNRAVDLGRLEAQPEVEMTKASGMPQPSHAAAHHPAHIDAPQQENAFVHSPMAALQQNAHPQAVHDRQDSLVVNSVGSV